MRYRNRCCNSSYRCAIGIGQIGKAAVKVLPVSLKLGSDIRTTMIISAALIEGVALLQL